MTNKYVTATTEEAYPQGGSVVVAQNTDGYVPRVWYLNTALHTPTATLWTSPSGIPWTTMYVRVSGMVVTPDGATSSETIGSVLGVAYLTYASGVFVESDFPQAGSDFGTVSIVKSDDTANTTVELQLAGTAPHQSRFVGEIHITYVS